MEKIISDIGASGINFYKALNFIAKGKINLDETASQVNKAGIDSIFIVSITSIFIGLALSTQLAKELSTRFGAEQLVGGIVGIAVVRELASVITAIVVAGRVGAAISAEIGSMKVSEQIDALSVLGINPIKYLLVPRLIACGIATPLLTVYSAILSICSGMLITQLTVHLSPAIYFDSARLFLKSSDIGVMILKSCVFGTLVSILATTTGLNIYGGAEAVGNAATKTVVWSIICIFTFNYLITSIFFGI